MNEWYLHSVSSLQNKDLRDLCKKRAMNLVREIDFFDMGKFKSLYLSSH